MKNYVLGLYEKSMPSSLTWQEKLSAAKKGGFDYLEMSIDETDAKLARLDMSDKELVEIKQAMLDTGVPIRSICLSGHRKYPLGSPSKEQQARSLEIMEKAIALAAKLGVRTIQLAGYDVYYEEGNEQTRADFEKNLKLSVAMAAKEGIVLGFETMETPFMDTVEKAMKYVNIVKSPYLGVYPDVGNITNASLLYKKNVADDLQTGEGHLVATHLKETIPGHYREIPFGTGHVDFANVIKKCWALGVRRYVAEFWYLDGQDYEKELATTNSFIRSYFEQIGE